MDKQSQCIHCKYIMNESEAGIFCDSCGMPWFGDKSGLSDN